MEGSDDHQDSVEMLQESIQETGESTTGSSATIGTICNANGVLLEDSSGLAAIGQTVTQMHASNAEVDELGMDETPSLYAEPSQEVGYNKPLSALVTGAAAVDPEVKMVHDFLKLTFIFALMAILLKSEKT